MSVWSLSEELYLSIWKKMKCNKYSKYLFNTWVQVALAEGSKWSYTPWVTPSALVRNWETLLSKEGNCPKAYGMLGRVFWDCAGLTVGCLGEGANGKQGRIKLVWEGTSVGKKGTKGAAHMLVCPVLVSVVQPVRLGYRWVCWWVQLLANRKPGQLKTRIKGSGETICLRPAAEET